MGVLFDWLSPLHEFLPGENRCLHATDPACTALSSMPLCLLACQEAQLALMMILLVVFDEVHDANSLFPWLSDGAMFPLEPTAYHEAQRFLP